MLMEREADVKTLKPASRRATSVARRAAHATHAASRPALTNAPGRLPAKASTSQTGSHKASQKQRTPATFDRPVHAEATVAFDADSDAPETLNDLDEAELEAAEIVAPKRNRTTLSPRKRSIRWSFVIAGLAVVGAIIYLVIANTGASAEYYMTINELRSCSSCQSQTVRVLGTVRSSSIVMNNATQTVTFVITQGAQSLPVTYSGVVPDTLKSGLQVVVEGRLITGVFHAQTLLVKCPSKFQSAPQQSGG